MKKRLICGLTVLSLAFATLIGCGSNGNTAGNGNTTGNGNAAGNSNGENSEGIGSSANGNAGTAEIETIKIYLPSGSAVDDQAAVLEAVNKISREKIGVEIELQVFQFGQWFQQYSLFLSGTEDFDILANYGDFSSAVSQGAAYDLTNLLAEYGQDIVALEGDFLKSGQVGGVQYAVPVYGAYVNTMGIQYREDIVKELGLEEQVAQVKSLEDWTPILAAVKEAYPEMTPFVTNAGSTTTNFRYGPWDSLGNNYGVLLNGGISSEIVNLFASDEYAEMCKVMNDWYNNGYTSKDIQTQTDSFTTLAQNDAAFSTLGAYDFNSAIYNTTLIGKEIGSIPMGEPTAKTYTNVTYTIMSTSKHPEAAMKFLNLWFSDDEVATLIKYGIEGVHYQLNENGAGQYLDGQNMNTCTYHLGTSFNNAAGIRWETEDSNYVQSLLDSNNNSAKSSALGFKFDTTNVINEITQLDNVCSKYQAGLESGALNPEENLPLFLKELEAAGIDTVIAEKQKQFEEWKAVQ